MTPAPKIIITGHAPDRHGWRIVMGEGDKESPVASSLRFNMTEDQARAKAREVLERMGEK